MNQKDLEEFEQMFLKDAALRAIRNTVRYDPLTKRMYKTIRKYGLTENQALLLLLDLQEAGRRD